MSAAKDYTGKIFGRLKAIQRIPSGHRGKSTKYRCLCSCGKLCMVPGPNLHNGHTKSCGCLRHRQYNLSHGAACKDRTWPEYRIWHAMKNRCYNPNLKNFSYWGGRGITVCEAWKNSFQNFISDMGRRPSSTHSIDRVNNDGNYEPSNCRWATRIQQANNKRKASKRTLVR